MYVHTLIYVLYILSASAVYIDEEEEDVEDVGDIHIAEQS